MRAYRPAASPVTVSISAFQVVHPAGRRDALPYFGIHICPLIFDFSFSAFQLVSFCTFEFQRFSFCPGHRLLRALIAISLANLCYLRIWDVLLHHPEHNYLAATPHNPVDYIAAIIGEGLLAVVLYFVVQAAWQRDRRWLQAIALLTILGIINMAYAVANVAFPGKESLRAQLPGKAVEPGYVAKNRVVWIGKQDARRYRLRHCRSGRLA